MYSVLEVAGHFLSLAKRDGKDLSLLKLSKLVYFAHGWSWAIAQLPLISSNVEVREGNALVISPLIYSEVPDTDSIPLLLLTEPFYKALIEKVWESYKDFDDNYLSKLTWVGDGPCQITVARHEGVDRLIIDPNLIRDYFSKILKKKK